MITHQKLVYHGQTYFWIYGKDIQSPDDCWRWFEEETLAMPRASLQDELSRLFLRDKAPSMISVLNRDEYQRFAGILCSMNATREQVKSMKASGVFPRHLEALAGFVAVHQLVGDRGGRRHHKVYVVELRPDVRRDKLARQMNPGSDGKLPCVYVGLTGLAIEKRLENHLAGIKSSRYVHKYGLGVLPHLYAGFDDGLEYRDAVRVEAALAGELRRQGYTVAGGH